MTKRWTDEDVERLVELCEGVLDGWQGVKYLAVIAEGSYAVMDRTTKDLSKALQPFRPDPDDDLIEAMAEAMQNLSFAHDDSSWRDIAKAALTVVKEKGRYASP